VEPTEPVDPAAPTEPRTGGEGPVPPVGLAEDAGELPGDDTLDATGTGTVLRGGAGDDTLSVAILIGDIDGNQPSHILSSGSGNDILEVDLALASFSSPLTLDSVTQEIDDEAGFTEIRILYSDPEGIASDIPLIIRVQGMADLSTEDFTINDGTLDGIGTDGNDTLIANEMEFGNQTTLDGGAEDDVLREDPGGAFTDLEFTFIETGTGSGTRMTGTIHLEGLTGITADDIAFAQLETQAPLFVRAGSATGL